MTKPKKIAKNCNDLQTRVLLAMIGEFDPAKVSFSHFLQDHKKKWPQGAEETYNKFLDVYIALLLETIRDPKQKRNKEQLFSFLAASRTGVNTNMLSKLVEKRAEYHKKTKSCPIVESVMFDNMLYDVAYETQMIRKVLSEKEADYAMLRNKTNRIKLSLSSYTRRKKRLAKLSSRKILIFFPNRTKRIEKLTGKIDKTVKNLNSEILKQTNTLSNYRQDIKVIKNKYEEKYMGIETSLLKQGLVASENQNKYLEFLVIYYNSIRKIKKQILSANKSGYVLMKGMP